MTNREISIMFKIIGILFLSAMLIIGCAMQERAMPEQAGSASNAPATVKTSESDVEEIVVTGQSAVAVARFERGLSLIHI